MTLPRMSHSRYEMYASCGEKYRLAKIERVPQTPGIYRAAGTAFHEWTDMYDVSPPWDTEVSHEDWYANRLHGLIREDEEKSGFAFSEWDNPARKKGANEAARDKFINELGPDMIRKYIDWRAQSAWSIADMGPCLDCSRVVEPGGGLAEIEGADDCGRCGGSGRLNGIEFEIEFEIQGVQEIVKIDRIFEIPETGQMVAIDTKTWRRRRVTAQLPTYLVALRQAGFNVGGAAYYEARKGTTTEIKDYRYWDEKRLATLHVQAAHMISEGWFLPRPSDDCSMCDVRRHCAFEL